MQWENQAAAPLLIFDGDVYFLEFPLAIPRGGVGGASAIARSINGGQRRGTSILILCSAARASAAAASVGSARSVPVAAAVAARVGSVASVAVAEVAVHIAFRRRSDMKI